MKRPTWRDLMSEGDWAEQRQHDLRHPGKVCQHCPTERAHTRLIHSSVLMDYYRHQDWVRMGLVTAGLMLLAALILFFA